MCLYQQFHSGSLSAHKISLTALAIALMGTICARVKFELLPDTLSQSHSELESNIKLRHPIVHSMGASQFLFVHPHSFSCFLSPYLGSTPSGCEGRMHGKDVRTEELTQVKLYILAPFSVTSERHQLRKMDLPLCC